MNQKNGIDVSFALRKLMSKESTTALFMEAEGEKLFDIPHLMPFKTQKEARSGSNIG